ncbi:hypothetical protein HMPREF3066_10610 [Neisseria sp. HMSC03D10]|nr:hypothetical protein HMPREF3066_10610 [Neisseria sp. HMSC03D10]
MEKPYFVVTVFLPDWVKNTVATALAQMEACQLANHQTRSRGVTLGAGPLAGYFLIPAVPNFEWQNPRP